LEDSIDAALEEGWARRGELPEMGQRAALRIRELVPANPADDFADTLLDLARQSDSRAVIELGVRVHD